LVPWVEPSPGDPRTREELALDRAVERRQALQAWGIGEPELQAFSESVALRVITPGSTAGEPLHVLSSLEHARPDYTSNPEASRASLSAWVSLLLRLLGRDPDPAKSPDHVLISLLADKRLREGGTAHLAALLEDVQEPPIEMVGAQPVD